MQFTILDQPPPPAKRVMFATSADPVSEASELNSLINMVWLTRPLGFKVK